MVISKKIILICGIHYNIDRGGGNQRNNLMINNFSKSDMIILSYENSSDSDNFLKFRTIPSIIKQFFYSVKVLYQEDIAAIYCHHYIFCLLKLLFRKKTVYEIHSLKKSSKVSNRIIQFICYMLADNLIVLSNGAKQILSKNWFINPNKIKVVLNGKE